MTMRRFTQLSAAAAVLFGCGSAPQVPASAAPQYGSAVPHPVVAPPERHHSFQQAMPDCPMQVPNTNLTSYRIEGGTALIFTTQSSPEELRRRAQVLAERYEREPAGPAGVPARVEITEIPDGVRLDVRAAQQRDVGTVQEHLSRRAQLMRTSNSCPTLPDERSRQTSESTAAASTSNADWCPASLPEVSVASSQSSRGVTLELVTQPAQADELRRRVRELAAIYAGPRGLTRSDVAPMPQRDDAPDVAYTTTLEIIPNGARIVVWAGNQAELAQIHRTLADHAAVMRGGSCPPGLSPRL